MSTRVTLPGGEELRLPAGDGWPVPTHPFRSRVAYAAAHVVPDPTAENGPGQPATLDWDTTLAFRHHLWRHGFGVAEAMDTAQRGMGLDYPATRELIRRSCAEAREVGGAIVAGVATDQLPPGPATLDQVRAAYEQQLADVSQAGALPVLMCSRHLAAAARSADDYLQLYDHLLTSADRPVLLHWLGEAFDPALAGYWGADDLDAATETVLSLIAAHPDRIDGIKLSLLDAEREVAMRRRLPAGVRLYTGDDFHYPELIRGDEQGYSDALLGIFAAIAPAAAAALHALDAGDDSGYAAAMAPTVPLSRHIFAAPTQYYKTGIAWLAWLAGHQTHFTMVGGGQSGRSPVHLAQALILAAAAGLLPDPQLAAARARAFFSVCGVPQ
ncbi:dihydrodipicolinate synthase family protein [Natronosporangium hydrolyticum]|uniref:Dihydrodipicolinate synthase family protein n=1 Tax=Natronosporangium hydrolyticum TaxID=2811111 RepID=A0A895YIA4_9ACTN|nr:dihydrodipicolinate synthase family protein [Natronosporangium hydrolyticum]QSB15782.1 dihydrodipicolinate synthase family protein [Natronosporangium hydrolyticum]